MESPWLIERRADLPAMSRGAQEPERARKGRGFSLPEVLVVITVIAILAGVGIPLLVNVFGASRERVATRNLNMLNAALNTYRQSFQSFTLNAASDTSDELAVIGSLKYRDPMIPGTPFLNPSLAVVAMSDNSTFRAYWNGEVFALYGEGESGAGIDLLQMDAATNNIPTYTNGYTPLGGQ